MKTIKTIIGVLSLIFFLALMIYVGYPLDYDFSAGKGNANFTGYLIGMSVPPLMIAHIASEVFSQWLAKLG